jgi:hypothetical protein
MNSKARCEINDRGETVGEILHCVDSALACAPSVILIILIFGMECVCCGCLFLKDESLQLNPSMSRKQQDDSPRQGQDGSVIPSADRHAPNQSQPIDP